MESTIKIEQQDDVVKIHLAGNLDATNAPQLAEGLKKLAGSQVKNFVFFVKDLAYISSAGLRIIIFAKQKFGVDTQVIMVGVQTEVLDVIKMSGMDSFISFRDSFEG